MSRSSPRTRSRTPAARGQSRLVKILLDENFPLPLYHRLREAGHDAEHIIALGQRGLPDAAIRQRLQSDDILMPGSSRLGTGKIVVMAPLGASPSSTLTSRYSTLVIGPGRFTFQSLLEITHDRR